MYQVNIRNHRSISPRPIELFSSTVMFGRISAVFVLVSIVAFFCAQSVEAAKGPRITHKVYFDIKHGDENLGRGKSLGTVQRLGVAHLRINYSYHGPLWWC